MRFAIASGLLAQTLPVTSEIEDLVAIFAGNLEKVDITSIHSLLQRGNDAKPKVLNGIRRKNGRQSGSSWLNQRIQHNEALKNAPQDKSVVVECDPNESADVGVLSCDPGKYCRASQSSTLGGVCTESAFSRPRSLQLNDSAAEYAIQARCNESSPYFNEDYGPCDCSGLDYETLSGAIVCQVHECFAPYCNDTCFDATLVYSGQSPLQYGYSICFEVNSPAGQEAGCYANYFNLAEDSFECTASWNGVNCTCDPLGNPGALYKTTIDCPGDGPSGICACDFLYEATALAECLPSTEVCYICPEPGSTINGDVILSLPGFDGNVSCVDLDVAANLGNFNSSFCPIVQTVAGPLCCTASSIAPSAPMDNETTTKSPSAPSDSVAPSSSPPTASPTPADGASGFANGKIAVFFMGLSEAMTVYFAF